MPPNNALSPAKRLIVKKVCVVGGCKDAATINLLQTEYNVEIAESVDGKEFLERVDEFVFLVESFTSDAFLGLFKVPGVRMMSPTYVRSRYRKHVELIAPRPNRPLYCELLKDTTIVMANMPNKSDIANIAHFLGASIRKEVIERATHVIATSVNCKQYRSAFSMGLPILRPEYILHIWERRDELDYDIAAAEMITTYRLLAFEGLKLAFIAFTGEERIDMEKQVKKYKGEVLGDERLATHVVFNAKADDLPKVELLQGQKHLTSEWLWQSVQMEGCAAEENYVLRQAATKKTSRGVFSPMTAVVQQQQQNPRQTKSTTSVLDTSNSSVLTNEYSTDDLDKVGVPSPKRIDKRHQVCMEMLETEQSYLRALHLVMKFKDALEAELEKGAGEKSEVMATKEDIFIIFSKFNKIIQVHNEICEKLRLLVEDWRPENEVGKAWIEAEAQLTAAYPPFINSFDTIKGTLDNLDMTNQRFHVFLKAQEASPEYRRNTMRDLIIRPVQRLPSVMLLLKEIDKRTDSKLADKESLKIAEQTIVKVLEKSNSRRALNDEYSKFFQFCSQIANVSADLYKSNRSFVVDLESESLGGTGPFQATAKRRLRMFLFNDCLEIAKVRRQASKEITSGMGTLSRLGRQLSMSNLKTGLNMDVKSFKHVEFVLLTSLRSMYYVVVAELKLLVLVLRSSKEGDEEFVLMPPDEAEARTTRNFVTTLSQLVYSQCGRDIGPAILDLSQASIVVQEIVRKVIFKRGLANSSLGGSMLLPQDLDDSMMMPLGNTTNSTTFSRGGGFRRALSNASLTISKKLHISRANLRSINEQNESSPYSPGFLPRSGTSSIASSISPENGHHHHGHHGGLGGGGGRDGTMFTPNSRYGHRQTSLRSLFSFTSSRSSIKRRESGKENNHSDAAANPAHRFSTQSTAV